MLSDRDIIKLSRAYTLMLEFHQEEVYHHSFVPGGTPYPAHIMETVALLQTSGADVDTCCAAFFHKAIKGYDIARQQFVASRCGEYVAQLARQSSIDEMHLPWMDRKNAYLSAVPNLSFCALMIAVASKVQNLREIRRRCWEKGDRTFLQELEGGYWNQKWFHETLVSSFRRRQKAIPISDIPFDAIGLQALLFEFERLVRELFCDE